MSSLEQRKVKIFIINLERSLERKEKMLKQIQRLFEKNPSLKASLEFVFFKAVDGKNGEHLEFEENFAWWGSWVFARELTSGEKACFASHYKLWQECLRLDEAIIVLEDDVEFSDYFLNGGIEELLKASYEYVRLCYIVDRKIYTLNKDYAISFEQINGTQGYMLKPSAARKFSKKVKYNYSPVDNYMDKVYKHKVLNVIKTPLLLKRNFSSVESEIGNFVRFGKKAKFYKKITREIFRIFSNIRKILFTLYMLKKLRVK